MTYTLDDYKKSFQVLLSREDKCTESWCETLLELLRGTNEYLDFKEPGTKEYIFGVMSNFGKTTCILNHYDSLWWEYMKFEAPHVFDSYLIYLERKRIRHNMFYIPKRKQLNKHGIIQAMQDLEDDKLDLLSISLPPGTGKTTLEKFFVSWVIGRHPEDYSLFFSHSGDITRMFYDGVLDITTNADEYCWGEIFPDAKLQSTNAKSESINFNNYKPFASLQCSSVGAKNAGKVRTNRYLFCDDLIGNLEEALSKTRLDKLWGTYGVDLRQRKLNQQVKEILIATRWSVHDPIGRIQRIYKDNPRAKFIAVPDIDPVTGESNFDYEINGMTVEFFRDQELMMDEISYRCLYKNEPIEREGLLYHEDELRRYLSLPLSEPDAILSVCDTKDKGTDFYALGCFLVYGNDHYFVDCVFDNNSDYGIQYERSANLLIDNKVQAVRFEHNNGGGRVAYDVSQILDERNYTCNVTSKHTSSNKETKIIVNSDWVKKHVIFKDKSLYSSKSDYGKCMENVLSYSVSGKVAHDDGPDMLAMYSEYVKNFMVQRPTEVYDSPL